jgi:hypothetical protein
MSFKKLYTKNWGWIFFSIQMLLFLHLLFLLVKCEYTPLGNPNAASFKYSYTFAETVAEKYSFYWNVTGNSLRGLMELDSTDPLSYSWIGIGIGESMLSAEFIVCHNLGNQSVTLHEHISVFSYAPPVQRYGEELMRPVLGSVQNDRIQSCQFERVIATATSSTGRKSLSATKPFKLLWAYNTASGVNYSGSRFTYHGNRRGAITIHLTNGFGLAATIPSFSKMQIHGYGMIALWLGVFPFGAYYARYRRNVEGWIIIKVLNQTVGVLIFLGFFFLILTNEPGFDKLHSFFGVAIAVIVFAQVIFGAGTALGLFSESFDTFKAFSRIVHRTTGYGLIVFAIVQIGLGIDILHPWVEPRTWIPWILYIFLVLFWVIAFGFSEWYVQSNYQRKDPGYAQVATDIQIAKPIPSGKKFSWESLNEEVKRGRMLVVANGKYVYDIASWISSHPGGQIILHSVCGTDITNDYFHEAGFDADEFTPRTTPPAERENRKPLERRVSRIDYLNMKGEDKQMDVIVPPSLRSAPNTAPSFSNEDWQAIQRSRRTHVHTRLAIEKLSSMVIGELEATRLGSTTTLHGNGDREFNIFEYRRYALTKFEHESPKDATHPFIRLRFCLLYPFDGRENQPKQFLPGHSVEIEVRASDGTRISRYYTPISGDMNGFELLVKIQPQGKMSQLLFKAQKGERQFKIRGPFGTPILPLVHPPHQRPFSTIYCFCGGSGITPFLQLANHLLLPSNFQTNVFF